MIYMDNFFSKLSDDDLLKQVSKGHEQAFNELYSRFNGDIEKSVKETFNSGYIKVYGKLFSTCEQRREELCNQAWQEIYTTLLKDKYDPTVEGEARGYLCTIANRTANSELKLIRKRRFDSLDGGVNSFSSLESLVENSNNEEITALEKGLSKGLYKPEYDILDKLKKNMEYLNEKERDFCKKYIEVQSKHLSEGNNKLLTQEELSKIIGISIRTISNRLSSIKKKTQ